MFDSFYCLTTPVKWAGPPEFYSFSSLLAIEKCPLRWQLEASEWPGVGRYPCRPGSAAVEGQLIHAALDGLFRQMGLAGLPEPDSPEFYDVIAAFDISRHFEQSMQEKLEEIARHPRGRFFRFLRKKQDLINEVINTFRSVYKPGARIARKTSLADNEQKSRGPVDFGALLQRTRYLSEVRLSDARLRLTGVIDAVFIENDRLVIVDFKTGAPRAEYSEQLKLYSLLWQTVTGQTADELRLVFPDQTIGIDCSDALVNEEKMRLAARISAADKKLLKAPTPASLADDCCWCSFRQLCPAYWQSPHTVRKKSELKKKASAGAIDVEIKMIQSPSETGSLVELADGTQLPIVWEPVLATIIPTAVSGQILRFTHIPYDPDSKSLSLTPFSEAFKVS